MFLINSFLFGSSSNSFLPSDLSSSVFWLDPAAIMGLMNDDKIAIWNDRTGNGFNGSQSDVAKKPVYKTNVINSLPIVRFTGGQILTLPSLSSLTGGEIFIVVRLANDPVVGGDPKTGLWDFGSDSTFPTHFPYTNGTIYDEFGTTARQTTVDPSPNLASGFHIYNVTSVNGEWTSRLDGTQLFTTTSNTAGFSSSPAIGGSVSPSGYNLMGDVGDVCLFNAKLSGSDRTKTYDYLHNKWS